VPPCSLIELADGELAFLIKRFDREKGQKVQIEDFASVLNLPAESKYSSSYLAIGQAVAQHCRDRGLEKIRIMKLVMLSYLLGNNDLHLKNFALIDREDHYELSPVYDVLCAARYYTQHDLALDLAPDYLGSLDTLGYFTANDFIELGRMLGIDDRPLRSLTNELLTAKDAVLDLIQVSFLPPGEQRLVAAIIKEQFAKFAAGRETY
jgi:serine/threonine-protein kinase HipA